MPLTMRQHEADMHQPAFCELLPVRDYLDNVIVRSNGSLVAGYQLAFLIATGMATLAGVTLNGAGLHTITANYLGVSGTFSASSQRSSSPWSS